jgi:hypothetical protein
MLFLNSRQARKWLLVLYSAKTLVRDHHCQRWERRQVKRGIKSDVQSRDLS